MQAETILIRIIATPPSPVGAGGPGSAHAGQLSLSGMAASVPGRRGPQHRQPRRCQYLPSSTCNLQVPT